MKDEGHMKGAFVNEISVRALTVFVQALAMIGSEHDQRLVLKATSFEESQKTSQHTIDVGQPRFVARLTAAQARFWRQIIRRVQIVEMEEQQERRAYVLIEPVHGSCHLGARSLEITHVRHSLVMKIERGVIGVEIAAQSETLVQHETA